MTDLISSTKSNLKKKIPQADNILVKVERDHEFFLSKIHVHVPGKVLYATKKAETAWEALENSYHAVLKQIKRKKKKKFFNNDLDSIFGRNQFFKKNFA
jgi:ribosome-associated translation inhibitor RaiA